MVNCQIGNNPVSTPVHRFRPSTCLLFYMRLFGELCLVSLRRHLTYRTATLVGLATNFFFGLMRAAILAALYGARREVAGITLQGAITYSGFTQAVIGYLSLFSWYEIMKSVYSGEVGADLLKPMDYSAYWMAQDLGRAIVNLVFRGLPILGLFALIFDLAYPESLTQWLGFALALALAWGISFGWRFLINLSAFWTPDARGIIYFFFVLSWFFSGFLMPLRFFPQWVQQLSAFTPFPLMLDTTMEIYLGILKGPEMVEALLTQLAWIAGLILAGQLVLRLGIRRLVIQGG